jgi:hypothetical protein
MNKEKATEFVVKELGKHHNRNEIIITLCEQMRLNWHEAEVLVQEIESQQDRAIAIRQSPVIIILGIGISLVGIGMALNSSLYIINFFRSQHNTFSVMDALELRTLYLQAGALLTGLIMIAGGIIGNWQLFSKLLKG